ncbi:MAG TPA: ROK family protein [Terriglobales bacterium]|nr:ROK family protein [Terriglobales bacterium]
MATSTVLAIDLGGTKICAAIVDASGKLLARKTAPVDKRAKLAPVKQMLALADELASYVGKANRYCAVGVAIPGLVRRDGTVWAPNIPGWDKIPLARLLEKELRVPVVVESDRAAAVLGEVFAPKGAARGKSDVVALIVGTGIGAGILTENRLLRGAHELSGCAGWMAVTLDDSPEVRQLGCLEAYTAGPGIARTGKAEIKSGCGGGMANIGADKLSSHDIAELARKGDKAAIEVYRRTGTLLGLAVANLISLFDPEVVVFGGGLSGAADCFWSELKQTALERCQPISAKKVKVVLSKLGNDANLLGAAKMAWEAAQQTKPAARARSKKQVKARAAGA